MTGRLAGIQPLKRSSFSEYEGYAVPGRVLGLDKDFLQLCVCGASADL